MAVRSYNGRDILAAENGNFESAPLSAKWGVHTGYAGAGTTITTGTDSTNYYKVTWGTAGGYVDNLNNSYIQVKPNCQYLLKFRLKTVYISGDSNHGVSVGLYQYNSARTEINPAPNTRTANIKTSQDWTEHTLAFTTKANNREVKINIRNYAHTGAGTLKMDIGVDDITLTEVLPARTPATSRTTATNRVAVRDMGTALSFDGSGDFVNLGASTYLNVFTNVTVSMWAYPTTWGKGLFVKGRGGSSGYAVKTSATGYVTLTKCGIADYTSTYRLPKNVFTHITLTINADNSVSLCANGIFVYLFSNTTAITASVNNGYIGTDIDGGGASVNPFNGIIDEPRIWNRALTATEISNLYFNNIVPQDGLVAEYLFDEASGTTAYDTSGNGNDGTISGATYTTDVPLTLRDSI